MTPFLITSNSLFFISTLLLLAHLAVAQPCAPVPRNLSAWLDFESPSALQIQGKVGKAIAFDGKNQFLELPSSTKGLDMGSEDFSIEFWLRTSEGRFTRSIVDKRDTSPTGYLIFISRGHLGFQVAYGADRADTRRRDVVVSDGRWHHVVATARRLPPQPPMLFIDGKTMPSASRNLTLESLDNATPLWLARHHANQLVNSSDAYFTGAIDELSFYRRALSPAEVRTLFRAGSSGKCRDSGSQKK